MTWGQKCFGVVFVTESLQIMQHLFKHNTTQKGVFNMKFARLSILASLVLVLLAAWNLPAAAQVSEGHKIKKVSEVGRVIELQDGSIWSIQNPEDWEIAYRWLPFQDISVINGNELRNDHNGERVDAKMTQEPTRPKAAEAPSSTPTYPVQVTGKPGPGPSAPAAMQPSADRKLLEKILKRLDTLDAKIQVMDWRLRKIEKEALSKP
jgi:hypothetical protein